MKRNPRSAGEIDLMSNYESRIEGLDQQSIGNVVLLAIECSKPAATKAVTGKMMARILSVTLWG